MQYYQVLISAEDCAQAEKILDALLSKKLVLGGPVLEGPAKFWWKGNICEMSYSYILTYTREDLKSLVVEEAENASDEEVCMISFLQFEGNSALIKLLDNTFGEPSPGLES